MARARWNRPRLAWLAYAGLSALLALLAVVLERCAPWQAALAHGLHLSVVAWALYGLDKRRARESGRRIRESTLLGLAVAGGALGAWLAMRLFRHKTKQRRFQWLVPLAFVGQVALVGWLAWR